MQQIISTSSNVLTLRLPGEKDTLRNFSKEVIQILERHKEVNLYIEAFDWNDQPDHLVMKILKIVIADIKYFNKVAVVIDKEWIGYLFELRSRVLDINLKTFQSADKEEAMLWTEY